MTTTDLKAAERGRRGGAMLDGLSPIEEVLVDYQAGKMVILVDDEDRENEGDLVVAADCVSAEHINFMASHGRGLICLTVTDERCAQLGLELQTRNNNERYSTNFTVSIEAAEGVTTGISAADRATTVAAAVKEGATARDIVTPGHIFPIMALPGGVLTRAGHTEAGVDMARITNHAPSSVICEILNEDGTMARLPQLIEFARRHEFKIGTIEDLIRYRLEKEPTVHRVEQHRVPVPVSDSGDLRVVAYQDLADSEIHMAFVHGDIANADVVPVRVQLERGLYDMVDRLDRRSAAAAWTGDKALEYMRAHGCGVLVVLQYRHTAMETLDRLREVGMETAAAPTGTRPTGQADHLRVLGLGSQILADLGVTRLRVLGSPVITHGLAAFDLAIDEYVTVPGADVQSAETLERLDDS